ncbi:MAG TPA: MFS transporter [Candidatus Binataceae bacterium]|jgi:MFS family permease|nr:MFS transporter [Candidatus Binataceae bacterium]
MREDPTDTPLQPRDANACARISLASRLLPKSATADAGWLILTRALRALGDGAVSILLVSYLQGIGFSAFDVGAIVTGTLLGSAALTLLVGLVPHGVHPLRLLKAAAILMLATGMGFALARSFWPLFAIAVIGTLNPSAGDVSVFLPMEQTLLSDTVRGADRTLIFAWYNVCATFTGAIGALLSALPAVVARNHGWSRVSAERMGFVGYALLAVAVLAGYLRMSPAAETSLAGTARMPLAHSRAIVMRLSALFSLDSFGGGFVVQSLLVLWLFHRFDLSPQATAAVFFAAGLLGGLSQFVSAWMAERIGLINTMVFTHLPANVFLVLAGVMPTARLAITFLLLRMLLSQMDVPARQSYVMAVVPPQERPAAASVTNVPRSLATALSPLLAGAMLNHSSFGWPLVCGGIVKAAYDLLLLMQFSAVKPHPESGR